MCGIVGLTNYQNRCDYERFCASTNLCLNRGPDEYGFSFGSNYSLGHRRLVVRDREHGQQPMTIDHFHLIYNGELYNANELRNELIGLGYQFKGYSDTEVLLVAYIEWRENCLEKIEGIYAFAIFDEKRMFFARDRLGVKPLYYAIKDNDIMISSEMKCIINYFDMRDVSVSGLQEILGMGPSSSIGKTPFDGIFECLPGYYGYFNGTLRLTKYWDLKPNNSLSYAESVRMVRKLLESAINRQLISDVPLGTLLSGGLDSSIITAVSAKEPGFSTFSVDYADNKDFFKGNSFQVSNDQDFIQYMVNKYQTKHTSYEVSLSDLKDNLRHVMHLRDMPGMVDIDASLFLLSRFIKQTHTVVLSGECADEIFGGYPWFYREDGGTDSFPWLRNLHYRRRLLLPNIDKKLELEKYVKAEYERAVASTPVLLTDDEKTKKERVMFYLNVKYFMNQLLIRKDRMSMGASLEIRVPFADHHLVEFLYNVPWSYKYQNGVEKSLLREAFKNLLPKEIVHRKKNPYPKTHSHFYQTAVTELFNECLDDEKSILWQIFSKEAVMEMIANEEEEIPWYGQLMTKPQLIAYLYQIHWWGIDYKINLKI